MTAKALAEYCRRETFWTCRKRLFISVWTGNKEKETTTFTDKEKILWRGFGIKSQDYRWWYCAEQFEGSLSICDNTYCPGSLWDTPAGMQDGGCRAAVIGVSSRMKHHRIWGLHLHAAVFTNLAEDHIIWMITENLKEVFVPLEKKHIYFRQPILLAMC